MTRRILVATCLFVLSGFLPGTVPAGTKGMHTLKTAAPSPTAIAASLSTLRATPAMMQQRMNSSAAAANAASAIPSLVQVMQGKQLAFPGATTVNTVPVSVSWNENTGVPRAITINYPSASQGIAIQSVLSSLASAQRFLAANGSLLHINDPAAEFAFMHSESDKDGMTHLRFQQQYAGIDLWGSDIYVHTGADGRVVLLNGSYHPTPTGLNTIPVISAARALGIVDQDLAARGDRRSLSPDMTRFFNDHGPTAKTVIWYDQANTPHLAWFVEERTRLDRDWYYFVDAQTGTVLHFYNNVAEDGPATGTANDLNGTSRTFGTYLAGSSYYLLDATQPMYDATNSQIPQNPVGAIVGLDLRGSDLTAQSTIYFDMSNNNTWSDPAAVSAHYNAIVVYNYYRTVFGRNSIDGNGMTIYSIVHAAEDGQPMDNAFWSGKVMCYGDGNTLFKPLAGGFDVAAHEMTHGVTQHTANLIYENQSGALNESMSDAFAAALDSANWTIGEQVIRDLATYPSGVLRNLQDPHNGGNAGDPAWQPSIMAEFVSTSGDNGGVHINSGIPNNAFYRVATIVGRARASAIWYKALTSYLTSSAQFLDARIATQSAAKQLFGDPSPELTAVTNAWDAVGVADGTPPPPPPPSQIVGDEWVLAVNTAASDPNSIYMIKPVIQSNNDFVPLSSTGVLTKPAVSDTSGVVVFVDNGSRLRVLTTNGASPTEAYLDTNAVWWSAAVGPGLTSIALTSRFVDTTIYYVDFVNQRAQEFKIRTTSYDGAPVATALYSDALSFDPTGRYLLFDAYNRTVTAQGDTISFWTIDLLDVTTGNMRSVFAPQPEGIDIGNPSFSKTNGQRFVFDYWDNKALEGKVFGGDFYTGKAGVILSALPDVGYPTLSGDGLTLAYHTLEAPSGMDQHAIKQIRVDSTGLNAVGAPTEYVLDATFPVWFVIGSRVTSVDQSPQTDVPAAFSLSQNYPNPFNPVTRIRYTVGGVGGQGAGVSDVSLVVYDVLGRTVAVLVNERIAPGRHEVTFDGSQLSSGVYFYRLTSGNNTATRAMMLVR
jgi:bacillolysin